MADRIHIPTSAACGQWETLLADALDGLLRPEDEATFTSHMASCAACTALFDEARRGQQWLEFLAPEPEVPAGLLDKILAQTGPGHTVGYELASGDSALAPAMPGGIPLANTKRPTSVPAWQRPGFMGYVRRFAEPRLMMTAAMAFFSIALTLNLTGVKLTKLRLSDLKPSAVRSLVERRLTMASTPIIRYYDNLRLVYEVQSRMRELRRNSEESSEPKQSKPSGPGESKQTPGHKDGGSKMDPPQQSVTPAIIDQDYLETELELDDRPAHSGGSAKARRERSTVWTA